MRDDHLSDLEEESRKHSQIADIEHDYLRENLEEINNIRNDIEENLETIVEKLDEQDLINNLNYYRQKIQVYRHKVEEQSDFFEKVISFPPEEYQSKLARVQDFMMDVWQTDSDEKPEPPMEPTGFGEKLMQHNDFRSEKQPYQLKANTVSPQYQLPKQNVVNVNAQNWGPSNDAQQPAFRKLFEEEEPVMAESSPQFKKI